MRALLERTGIPLVLLCSLGMSAATPDTAFAWSRDGHRIACEIAWQEIDGHTRTAIRTLLAHDRETRLFHEACFWADLPEVRGSWRYREDRARHYVNIPPGSPGYLAERDCSTPCVVEGIEHYGARLGDRSLSPEERLEALKFYGHFVADVHQPLHAGHARDRGGNGFPIRWRGRSEDPDGRAYNLHLLWDVLLLDAMNRPWKELAHELHRSLGPEDRRTSLDPVVWTNESFRLVEERIYRGIRPGTDLREAYAAEQSLLVRERLKEAGVRLGQSLDKILAPDREPVGEAGEAP